MIKSDSPMTGKTSNQLEVLLSLTGIDSVIKSKFPVEWSVVSKWNPEARYNAVGKVNKIETKNMIDSSKIILHHL